MKEKRYKFQAVVTLPAAPDSEPEPYAASQLRRLCIRGQHHDTGSTRFFNAMGCSGGVDGRGPGGCTIMTITLVSTEPRQYFDVGDQFTFWQGSDVGRGVVTRRLFAGGPLT